MNNQAVVSKRPGIYGYFKKLYAPFYTLMKWYVEADLKRYYCQITLGHDMPAEELDEIQAFRNEQYKEKQSYLIPLGYFEKMRERNLDLHAYHVVVRRRKSQEIVGVMRLGLYPFEVNTLKLSKNIDTFNVEDRGEADYHFISANFGLISKQTMSKFLPRFLKA